MSLCVWPVIDHKRHQNVVRTSVMHSAITSCVHLLSLSLIQFGVESVIYKLMAEFLKF